MLQDTTRIIFDDLHLEDEVARGYALATEELLQSARDLLSSALPEDASDRMIKGFWEAVFDYI